MDRDPFAWMALACRRVPRTQLFVATGMCARSRGMLACIAWHGMAWHGTPAVADAAYFTQMSDDNDAIISRPHDSLAAQVPGRWRW